MNPVLRSLPAAALLAALLAAVLLLVQPADGCSPVMARGAHVAIAGESAIIIWDEQAKKQHFIRRAAFDTKVPYFGFLVPTPTKPELKEAPDEWFSTLEDWTKPPVETRKIPRQRTLSRSMMPGNAAPAGKAVEVLDAQRVAGYDAVVLKATDAKALEDWLQKHGYATRPELTKWLEPYIKDGWIITAFQIPKPDATQNNVSTQAVQMSFATDRPFYPYSEPADQRTSRPTFGGRLLRVFLIGTRRMNGALEDKKPWPGRTVWANHLTAKQASALQDKLEKNEITLPEKPYLTVFDDSSSPRPGTADLFFSPSADQSTVSRPPIINYVEVDEAMLPSGVWWWIGAVVLGGTVLSIGLVFGVVRLLLRRASVAG
jgi:hypothetical protein